MQFINKLLLDMELDPRLVEYLSIIIKILLIGLICIVANFISKKIVIRIITRIVTNSKVKWSKIILERQIFRKLSHIVPAIIIYSFSSTFPTYQSIIEKLAITYIIIVGLVFIQSLLNALNDIYQTFEISRVKPIKGYIQVINIIIMTLGFILVISNLIGESPLILLSGIGALSAVLMLVFKDSLLGLVSGIQLTANDMVRVGDWIEMPKYGADGDVIDISLNTVKVQNGDKTITMIPSYALTSDSFKNWRGMQSSGGRRIKRSLYIDTSSITFCTDEMIEKFIQVHYLSDFIIQKEMEITEYNAKNEIDRNNRVNGRALTNIGVFRAYISNYLKNHHGINQNMTVMVRQLGHSEYGLPLEIYAFTNDVQWAVYESVQSDIFDHLFAVAPEFGLRVFQNPSGADLRNMVEESSNKALIGERSY
ncbi:MULTISPECIES: mechanosensitive ion channel family protein [Metabacillus]|uniref:Mechanosensitive ion channel family protein n=1 Tax=Metabacillus rhizolycopersici TaxID=2875709 RepID=A0ABS7UMS3_9BACI|nr:MULTISPECIES: mechanosensitive ion channel family protein [Metabacillus]MBZ5749611.1 mechanosensitive ion channel family protein [Metabacillus rhizolycopersici]MCM3653922.1 mechanosensitive ion channel family protein [Metabacillus litoralis]